MPEKPIWRFMSATRLDPEDGFGFQVMFEIAGGGKKKSDLTIWVSDQDCGTRDVVGFAMHQLHLLAQVLVKQTEGLAAP